MFKEWKYLDTTGLVQTTQKWIWKPDQDAMQASTRNHRILFENDEVRILEVIIQPGEKEDFHTHQWKSIFIVDSLADMRYYGADGEMEYERLAPPFFSTTLTWKEPEGLHAVENISQTTILHGIRIELKQR